MPERYTDEELAEMDEDQATWIRAQQKPFHELVASAQYREPIEMAAAYEKIDGAEQMLEFLVGPVKRVLEGADDTPIAGAYVVYETAGIDGWLGAYTIETADRTYSIMVVER